MTPFLTKWVLQVVDNFTKYSCLHLLYSKEKDQVIPALTEQLYFFEVPTILHSDNGGGGFKNKKRVQILQGKQHQNKCMEHQETPQHKDLSKITGQ